MTALMASLTLVAVSVVFAAIDPPVERWRARVPVRVVVRCVDGWSWGVYWPGDVSDDFAGHGVHGTARTWLGAWWAAWKAAR